MINDGKVLVARAKGTQNTFLPGGHIEIGEKAEVALAREIKEEIGKDAKVKGFLGAIENEWGNVHFEINLLFMVDIEDLSSAKTCESQEAHLEFLWLRPEQLKEFNLLPEPAIGLIHNLEHQAQGFWGSTLSDASGRNLSI